MSTQTPERVEQRGFYLDELREGVIYTHRPRRTLTETDNVLFTTLTMNNQGMHLDAAWSATQPFRQRLMKSLFTLGTLIGQSVPQMTEGTVIGQLGIDAEVPEIRLSKSRPGQGIVTMKRTGRNQDGVIVATATRTCMMWTKDAHAASMNTTEED